MTDCEEHTILRFNLSNGADIPCPYCKIAELEKKLINLGTYKGLLAEAEATIKYMKSHPSHKKVAELEAKYYDLLYQVGRKHPNESRHDTAKRYIQQAETPSDYAGNATQEKNCE